MGYAHDRFLSCHSTKRLEPDAALPAAMDGKRPGGSTHHGCIGVYSLAASCCGGCRLVDRRVGIGGCLAIARCLAVDI